MILKPIGLGIGITEPTGLLHVDAGTSTTGTGTDITLKSENALAIGEKRVSYRIVKNA